MSERGTGPTTKKERNPVKEKILLAVIEFGPQWLIGIAALLALRKGNGQGPGNGGQ
jgi:hypothetical protein